MSRFTISVNYIRANIKRLTHYLPHLLVSVLLLLLVTGAAGFYMSGHLYKENLFSAVSIGYYLPEEDNADWTSLGLGMLEDLEGMQETVQLRQVTSVDEGYRLLEQREILFLIIVPENFFSGIMDSTNLPLDIVVYDNSSFSSYVITELFMSYAGLLGTAQAGIYSGLDTMRAHNYDSDQVRQINNRVNLVLLDRVLNKGNYIETIHAENAGGLSLPEHYVVFAVLLSLCFTAFILIPYLQGTGRGIKEYMQLFRMNTTHIWIANIISTLLALYIAFLPCYISVSIWSKQINPMGLLLVFPVIFAIAFLISGIATFSRSTFSANMCVLFIVLVLAYCGGGLLPDALLPKVIQTISPYLPGHYAMQFLGRALF